MAPPATKRFPSFLATDLAPLVLAGILGLLLLRGLFAGQAQSHDPTIYARALWGFAHGDFQNSVFDLNSFSIHGNFLMLALAPLAWVLSSAAALIIAQSFVFYWVARLTLGALIRTTDAAAVGRSRAFAAAFGCWLVVLVGSPIVSNPFLYDVRPDFLGLPFLLVGLLRAMRLGGFDGRSVLIMAIAALAREEFALVVASAVLFSPKGAPGTLVFQHRVVVALGGALYFAAYSFALRPMLGGTLGVYGLHVLGGGASSGGDVLSTLVSWPKIELLLVIVASAGGLAILGWRWAGGVLPGVAILLLNRHLPESQLNFHYGLFLAPSLIVAAVSGFGRVAVFAPKTRVVAAGVVAAVSAASFLCASSAPGGARFARYNFDLGAPDGGFRFGADERTDALARVHARLAEIPREHGVAAPFAYSAPLADRRFIMTLNGLDERLSSGQPLPDALTSVAVPRSRFSDLGRRLALAHGFKLSGFEGRAVEVMTRDAARVAIPWDRLGTARAEAGCERPLRTWPAAGLALCHIRMAAGETGTATILRVAEAAPGFAAHVIPTFERPVHGPAKPNALFFLGGLITLSDLPTGVALTLRSERATTGDETAVNLWGSDGRVVGVEPAR
ncbi:MAG: DUF2079 domain-containing protein [Deltaproteobacteria bacterium]|nr:DUF2079 domain-containing protein [Deltaproteobacteria bacterium]